MRLQRIYNERYGREPEPFRKLMKRERQAQELSQKELGKIAGYSQEYISELERGEKPVNKDVEFAIRNALQINCKGL